MMDDEAAWLAAYREGDYAKPSVTVDLVILTVLDTDLKVLLVRRKEPPFRDRWALPGGFVRVGRGPDRGEGLEQAAHRELEEETGLPAGSAFLEQLHTFGAPDRDPRMRVISVAWTALVRPDLAPIATAGSDAARVTWASVNALPGPLAFDHDAILTLATERARSRIDHAPIAFELVPPTFTVAELRSVYEAIKGQAYNPGNFRRRFARMLDDGVIEQAPGKRSTGTKPAQVYRFRRS
jgi:8-oxo-dGTP diphosphatase